MNPNGMCGCVLCFRVDFAGPCSHTFKTASESLHTSTGVAVFTVEHLLTRPLTRRQQYGVNEARNLSLCVCVCARKCMHP